MVYVTAAFFIAFFILSGIVLDTMVIRMRHTRGHSGNRRSHHALKAENLSKCSHCGANHRPHHMCLECGYYNGRQVIDLVAAKSAREARMKEKAERIKVEAGVPAPEVRETKEEVNNK